MHPLSNTPTAPVAAFRARTLVFALALAALLSSCASNRDSEDPPPANNEVANADINIWYCYGVAEDEPWECTDNQDEAREPLHIKSSRATSDSLAFDDLVGRLADDLAENTEFALQDAPESLDLPEDDPEYEHEDENEDENEAVLQPDDLARRLGEYTVQVITLKSLEAIRAFADDTFSEEGGIAESRYTQIVNNQGEDVYVLLTGFYPSRDLAREAARQWHEQNPDESEPSVRSVASLHKDVKERQVLFGNQ